MGSINLRKVKRDNQPIRLSNRELEIAVLIMDGNNSKEVAERLFISKRTVDYHLWNIFAKLDVTNRMQMCRRMATLQLVPQEM